MTLSPDSSALARDPLSDLPGAPKRADRSQGIMACIMGAYPLLNFIPVAALAGVMLVVVIHTFKWFSLQMVLAALMPQQFRDSFGPRLQLKVPRIDVFVIVVVTVLSNFPKGTNIAYAVGVGVAICAVNYAWKSGNQLDWRVTTFGDKKYYDIDGPCFFAATNRFVKARDVGRREESENVRHTQHTPEPGEVLLPPLGPRSTTKWH